MDRICIYLRKSRADVEAEARGEGETLAKHKKALLKLAGEKGWQISRIYEEIVSGESLLHRPAMLEVLKGVENGLFQAVLCMDLDRLGRGNMQEQGLILETFKKSGTKIITPRKTYDLRDEWDEEYSEFEAFMARKELKIITRRLQSGRIRSVEEGNYLSTLPPFGYSIARDSFGRYLVPHPEQAPVVQMIFAWYTGEDSSKSLGAAKIAERLNRLGYTSYRGNEWQAASVLTILKNAVYTGRIQWRKKETRKSVEPGKKRNSRLRPVEEWIDVKGKHQPIIDSAIFQKAEEIRKTRRQIPCPLTKEMVNPLAGLIICAYCGSSMVFRPYKRQKYAHLVCPRTRCPNKSSRFSYVEKALLAGLNQWYSGYSFPGTDFKTAAKSDRSSQSIKKTISLGEQELAELKSQMKRLHDLLERGIYGEAIFLSRREDITERISRLKALLDEEKLRIQEEIKDHLENMTDTTAGLSVMDLYGQANDFSMKNNLLKTLLEKAVYKKESDQKNDAFTLDLYPKLPARTLSKNIQPESGNSFPPTCYLYQLSENFSLFIQRI